MKSSVLSNWNIPWLPSLALILFLTVFIIMLVMIFRKGSKELYAAQSALPLEEEGRKNNE
ncbi:MAG: cbb3-type cytochrome c oxidase subunit 3 [Bacteriovoracaceae bacterium]|jgi:cbb3-type cytochrome oxidase subunit 3|nr:cbb3-type cytochrome c oxidase subunit 3 [Bacteriovoracaceae bacterium]|tara:strand:+ start:289 stop:468 length:180 start_codon:yes stop_codon:yes gene_type:complete